MCVFIVGLRKSGILAKRLVVVTELKVSVDSVALARSLETHPWFTVGRCSTDPKCWHVGRLHHRTRLLAAPEAAIERLGSIMNYQYEACAGLTPAQSVDRLLLDLWKHILH